MKVTLKHDMFVKKHHSTEKLCVYNYDKYNRSKIRLVGL